MDFFSALAVWCIKTIGKLRTFVNKSLTYNGKKLSRMKSSWPTHNIINWSTTLKKMNCLLALLTHFKSIFHFYTPWKHKKNIFSCFQEVWKWNSGLKLVKAILNNFLNGYLIFTCSYPQAELYSIQLHYAVNGTWTHNF